MYYQYITEGLLHLTQMSLVSIEVRDIGHEGHARDRGHEARMLLNLGTLPLRVTSGCELEGNVPIPGERFARPPAKIRRRCVFRHLALPHLRQQLMLKHPSQ